MDKFYILTVLAILQIAAGDVLYATVYYNSTTGSYYLEESLNNDGIAFGSFNDSLGQNGWGVLQIQTNNDYSDDQQMYAAGYLEGALTADRIWENYQNMYDFFFSSSAPSQTLMTFLSDQDQWTRGMITSNRHNSYWQQVGFIMNQFDGLVAGYNGHIDVEKILPVFAFQTLNGVGDYLDLLSALEPSRRTKWDSLTKDEFTRRFAINGHCSALVKVLGDYSDLFAGHSSWFTFGAMNRIYKHYNFDLNARFVAAKKMSFSSYPGFLESLDDFYMMDSGLVMLQTTNSIFNTSLYELVQPKSLFAWQRVKLANTMATSGKQWADLVSRFNSGTYNNQYMVIDYNKFTPGEPLLPGTLWVVEQIPGLVERADVTNQLERGYWPSYNVPFFERIYNLSGYPEIVEKYGNDASYQMCARAQIFRRDQGTVVDFGSFKAMLRYNNYKSDPISNGDPGRAICSRFDLESTNPGPFGCYDTKVTSFDLVPDMISHSINGPTTSHGIPPFEWIPEFNSTAHYGQPQVYNFDFVVMDPGW